MAVNKIRPLNVSARSLSLTELANLAENIIIADVSSCEESINTNLLPGKSLPIRKINLSNFTVLKGKTQDSFTEIIHQSEIPGLSDCSSVNHKKLLLFLHQTSANGITSTVGLDQGKAFVNSVGKLNFFLQNQHESYPSTVLELTNTIQQLFQ